MKTRQRAKEAPPSGKRAIKSWVLTLYSACLKNAGELLDEADLLLKYGHAARAFFLGYTAFEELAKSQVVADYFSDQVAEAEFEAAFRDHAFKAAYISRYVQIPEAPNEEWFIEYDKATAKVYPTERARALYVERKPDDSPQVPRDEVPRPDAERIVAAARKYLDDIVQMEYLTERIGTNSFTK